MGSKVYVVGVGMSKIYPINTGGDYPDYGKKAVLDAIADAGVKYEEIDQAVCCYVYGSSCAGQYVLYQIGMTGIPIYNVNNNSSSGSTGIFLAKQLIEGGTADIVLVLGFEKMQNRWKSDTKVRSDPLEKHSKILGQIANVETGDLQSQIFGNAALEYMKKSGTTKLHIAKVAAKNFRHGAKNPRAQNRIVYNVDEILTSRKIYGPLTKLECCPLSDGAAAAILMSEEAVLKFGLQAKAVEIVGMEMATDSSDLFKGKSCIKLAGYDATAQAARRLYYKTKISPKDIDIVELDDCYAPNEIISYETLQLCGVGETGKFIEEGDNTYGGRVVVNPSGGMLARGNPLGATGLAQCAELVWQLRGEAGNRQVPNAKLALQHNQGIGGATVVAIYKRGFTEE